MGADLWQEAGTPTACKAQFNFRIFRFGNLSILIYPKSGGAVVRFLAGVCVARRQLAGSRTRSRSRTAPCRAVAHSPPPMHARKRGRGVGQAVNKKPGGAGCWSGCRANIETVRGQRLIHEVPPRAIKGRVNRDPPLGAIHCAAVSMHGQRVLFFVHVKHRSGFHRLRAQSRAPKTLHARFQGCRTQSRAKLALNC